MGIANNTRERTPEELQQSIDEQDTVDLWK